LNSIRRQVAGHRGPPVKISATIITRNEQDNLPRALKSLGCCCDEIVIVDSGSTDSTVEVARRLGARVIEREWTGYANQKNFAAGAAGHDWILALDADEALSEELQREIDQLKQQNAGPDGYDFPRLAQYRGKWIRHSGWYPDRKVRLYDRRKGRWVGDYVHESVRVEGRVGQLQGDLLHYTCPTFSRHVETVNRYTTLAAQEMAAQGRHVSLPSLLLAPPWAFVRSYLVQRGFLDGREGFLIAAMAAFYVFAKYAKAKWPEHAATSD
jgi:glycosyltransferase involved in cell wall biosynthesis